MANTCEMHVGRLMEIRVADGYRSVRDVDRMIVLIQTHMSAMGAGERYVVAADWRNVSMMAPDIALRAREMLSRSNPRLLRSAILSSPDQSLANLQVVRLIREAESMSRRHFISAQEQYQWLAEVLTPPERTRLAHFLCITRASELPLGGGPAQAAERARHSELPRSVAAPYGAAGRCGAAAPRSSASLQGSSAPRSTAAPRSVRDTSARPSMIEPPRRTLRPGDSDL